MSAENDEENENTDNAKYYHYTDIPSAVRIGFSQKIRQSEDKHGDAIMGSGTYLTQLGPSNSKLEVAKNNYDTNPQFYERKIQQGKTDACIEVVLPKNEVEVYSGKSQRDVHRYPGSIDLTKVKNKKSWIKTGETTCVPLHL